MSCCFFAVSHVRTPSKHRKDSSKQKEQSKTHRKWTSLGPKPTKILKIVVVLCVFWFLGGFPRFSERWHSNTTFDLRSFLINPLPILCYDTTQSKRTWIKHVQQIQPPKIQERVKILASSEVKTGGPTIHLYSITQNRCCWSLINFSLVLKQCFLDEGSNDETVYFFEEITRIDSEPMMCS